MTEHKVQLRASELEDSGNVGCNPTENATMGEIIATRFNRRDLVRGALAVTAISATVGNRALAATEHPAKRVSCRVVRFRGEVEAGVDQTHHVAEGHDAQVLLRWGDPIFADAPEFDPLAQTAKKRRQFGYNSDYVGYIPLDGSSDHGLLVVNHEYTNEELMFPGVGVQNSKDAGFGKMTKDLVDIEMAAHGGAVVEIRRQGLEPWR